MEIPIDFNDVINVHVIFIIRKLIFKMVNEKII